MLTTTLKRRMLQLAKKRAPIESGNTRHNAIQGQFWNDPYKFTIHYSSKDAHYIEPQEEGFVHYITGEFIDKNKGFILGTYLDLLTTLNASFNKRNQRSLINKIKFSNEELQDNPLRVYRHNRSLDLFKAKREVNSK